MTRHDPSLCETLHPGKTCLDSAHDTIDALMARGGTAAAGEEGLRAVKRDEFSAERRGEIIEALSWWEGSEGRWGYDKAANVLHAHEVEWCGRTDTLDATPAPTEDPAPSQDTLRAAVEEAAEDFRSNVDWSDGRSNYGDNEAWESAARTLDALLAATTPEATGRDGGPAK